MRAVMTVAAARVPAPGPATCSAAVRAPAPGPATCSVAVRVPAPEPATRSVAAAISADHQAQARPSMPVSRASRPTVTATAVPQAALPWGAGDIAAERVAVVAAAGAVVAVAGAVVAGVVKGIQHESNHERTDAQGACGSGRARWNACDCG